MLNQTRVLLPYRFQVIGWWLIVGAILVSIALIMCAISGIKVMPAFLGWIPAYAGILLVCVSREKVDDEYIGAIRARIVCILAATAITVNLVCRIIEIYGVFFHALDFAGRVNILRLFVNPVFLVVIYIIVLKVTLLIQRRKINSNDEQ